MIFFLEKEAPEMEMNLSVFVSVSLLVVAIVSLFSDGPIFPRFVQTGVSIIINILPVIRILRSEENLSYTVRKIKQFAQNYQSY